MIFHVITPHYLLACCQRFSVCRNKLRRSRSKKIGTKVDLGATGSVMEWRAENGVIREEILKTGLHDVIMAT
jgi:hypothetical protein